MLPPLYLWPPYKGGFRIEGTEPLVWRAIPSTVVTVS